MIDEAGRIVFANLRACELFGVDPARVTGMPVDDLVPESLRALHARHRERYGAEPRIRAMGAGLTLFGRHVDGEEFPVEIGLSPVPTDDGLRVVAVVRDARERMTAEARLRAAEQHLQLLEERERIGRDLHDLVIQKLFAAGMALQATATRSDDPDLVERLERVVDDLDDTIRTVRSVIFGLHAEPVGSTSTSQQIQAVVDDATGSLGFVPVLRVEGPVEEIGAAVAAELVPTLREALSNVARHARATTVAVDVVAGPEVTLRVADDGVGLPTPHAAGSGIGNVTRRAVGLGGRCTVAPGETGGTVVEWRVPNRPAT